MARFKMGKEAHAVAAVRASSGAFTPSHKFDAGETKFLQFLTSWAEIAVVEMHRFIIIGEREDGSDKFADFIVGEDDETGERAYDPIKERFGIKPVQRRIALAVELEPAYDTTGTHKVLTGWDLVMRQFEDSDGVKHEVPNVALVNESPFTFYGHLASFDDMEPIENVVFAVKRTGKSTDTQYTLMKAGEAVAGLADSPEVLEFYETFDFVGYLEAISDDERMHELIDPLPDDAVLSRFQNKGKNKGKKKSESAASTRTRRAKEEPAGDAAEEVGAEGGDAEAQPAARSRRFSALKSEMTA